MWLLLLAAYLCGSIPFGLLIVRAVAGVDLRKVGSGNIGATNTGRVVGKTWAIAVLVLDALKGALPTCAAPWFVAWQGLSLEPQTAQVLAGISAILGHMFPVWLGFRGGKGVATALGVVSVLSPYGTLAAAAVFAAVFALRRIVSLSSLAAAVAFAGYQFWILQPEPFGPTTRALALFSFAVPALIVVRHAGNIARLLRGQESTYSIQKKEAGNPAAEGSPPRQSQDLPDSETA